MLGILVETSERIRDLQRKWQPLNVIAFGSKVLNANQRASSSHENAIAHALNRSWLNPPSHHPLHLPIHLSLAAFS